MVAIRFLHGIVSTFEVPALSLASLFPGTIPSARLVPPSNMNGTYPITMANLTRHREDAVNLKSPFVFLQASGNNYASLAWSHICGLCKTCTITMFPGPRESPRFSLGFHNANL
jgi:hypothetical protein